MFKFGENVKDKITGFQGIVTGKCEYITGCAQYLVQPRCKKMNEYVQGKWFDEERLEKVKKKRFFLTKRPTGPCDSAPIK